MHLSRDTEGVSLKYTTMLHRPSFTVDGVYVADHNDQTCSPLKPLSRTKSILIWSIPRKGEPMFV